jgi:aconitate hydratase
MGVLPLNFKDGMTRNNLNLKGDESIDITGIEDGITPAMDVICKITGSDGVVRNITLTCRIDTFDEIEYFKNGGILHKVIRDLI